MASAATEQLQFGTDEYRAQGKVEYWSKEKEGGGRWHNGSLEILGKRITLPSDFCEHHGDELNGQFVQVHGAVAVRARDNQPSISFRSVTAAYLVTKEGLREISMNSMQAAGGARRRAA